MNSSEVLSQAALRLCYGVLVLVPEGASQTVRCFLQDVLGLEPRYIEERIQTILLDGLAVDGLDTYLPPGARLALSAAMPGVVGATLRRGGEYASLRQSITHKNEVRAHAAPEAAFWVELRCFNEIARELGPSLLHRGVAIPGDDLTPCLYALAVPVPEGLPPLPGSGWLWLANTPMGEHVL